MTFNESLQPDAPTLEAVKIQLDRWRATKGKGSRTPKHLWEAIKTLTKHHTYSQISSQLKINPHRLQAKMEEQYQQDAFLKTDFIEVPLLPPLASSLTHPHPPEQQPFQSHRGTLEFTRPDGTAFKASGLNHQDLFTLTQSFLSS
jgi:hypothetical protein